MSSKIAGYESSLTKLNGINYVTWKFTIQTILVARELWDICRVRNADDSKRVKNAEAKALIFNSMDDTQKARIGNCETAHDLWIKIQETYEGSESNRAAKALQALMTIKCHRNEAVEEFCSRFEIALTNLDLTGYHLDENMRIYTFKNALPSELYEKADTWEMCQPKQPKLAELITLMRRRGGQKEEETQIALYMGENAAKKSTRTSNPSAMPGKGGSSPLCNYCRHPGHFSRECNKRKGDERRKKQFAERKKKIGTNNDKRPEQAYVCVEKPREQQHASSSKGKATRVDTGREWQTSQRETEVKTSWIVDSGATKSMTSDSSMLAEYTRFTTPHGILIGDGKPILAYGLGSIFVRNGGFTGWIHDVLYSPVLSVNLLSVKQLMKEGFDVLFKNNEVKIRKNSQVIIGSEKNGLIEVELKIDCSQDTQDQLYSAVTIDDWHRRFGHISHATVKELAKKKAVTGLTMSDHQENECVTCAVSKMHRTSHPPRRLLTSMMEAQIIHFDTCGPISPTSLGGNRYFVLATDQISSFKFIKFAKGKGEIPSLVKAILAEAKFYSGKDTTCVVSDNGSEFVNRDLRRYLEDKNIIQETSTPYTPQQNGLAERANRTIIESVRSLLADSKLTHRLWTEAAATSVYVSNRTLSKNTGITRYEKFTGTKPDVSHLRIFGQYAVALIQKQFREGKWSPAGRIFRMVGYTSRSNTYRLFDETNQSVIVACDVRFLLGQHPVSDLRKDHKNEEVFTFGWAPRRQVSFASEEDTFGKEVIATPSTTSRSSNHTGSQTVLKKRTSLANARDASVNEQIHDEILRVTGNKGVTTRSRAREALAGRPLFVKLNRLTDSQIREWTNETPVQANGTDNREKDKQTEQDSEETDIDTTDDHIYMEVDDSKDDSNLDQLFFAIEDEPLTVQQAKESSESSQWRKAMDQEMESLRKNGTWILVDKPEGAKTVKCKWVFKRKLAADGSVGDFKARLVAKGYSQIAGVDYKETFAPVAQMNTVRALFAMVNQFNLELAQFDVKTAFLYGDLEETIYMDFPEGYPNPKNKVCKLVKSLYGLKQSPRQWNLKFKEFLTKFKLKQSLNDRCLYFNEDRSIFVVIYVDDGLIASRNKKQISELLRYLEERLEIKHLPCVSYLGFQVNRDRQKKEIVLHQANYVQRILERFKMTECKHASTPEEVGQFSSEGSKLLTEEYPYKEAIGSLLYLVTCTRPDIAHAVSIASRTSQPTIAHWNLVKRILRYLAGSKELGLRFRWEDDPKLCGYCDADYANDMETRRSTSGYGIFYGNALIAWRCQRQPIVSLSTTEAEYISGCELVKDLLPIREMLIELRMMQEVPTKVFVDNLSAVHIAKDSGGQQRTKHIDVRHKWLSEQHESKKIQVEFIPGEKQLADMLTKPLHKTKFQQNRNMLMTVLTTMIVAVACLVAPINAFAFKPVSPVIYEPARMPYFIGHTQMNITFKELNPCKLWFTNITAKTEWNNRLVDMCNSTFVDRTLRILKYCKEPDPGEVVAHKLYYQGPLTRKTRQKRAIPLLAFFNGISALGTVYAVHKSRVNAGNIDLLHNEVMELKKINSQATGVLKEIKEITHDLIKTDKEILAKIKFLAEDAENMKKAAYLVNRYETYFDDIGELLRDVNKELVYQRFSPSLSAYVHTALWEEPAAHWSSLTKCSSSLDHESNFVLKFEGRVPQRDSSIKIMQARSIKFWNRTSAGDYCWMRYTGPRYIIANTSSNCYDDLDANIVIDESVTGVLCDKKDQHLRNIEQLYVSQGCFKSPMFSERDEQVILYNGDHHIYCPNATILVHNSNYSCPEYVFPLSTAESFTLRRYRYVASKTNEVVINSLDRQLNEDIKLQLHTDVKIVLANTTRLDIELERYSRLVSKLTGREVKLEKPTWLVDSLLDSVMAIPRFFGEIWGWIKHGMIAMFAIATVWILILITPAFKILMIVLLWPYSKVTSLLSSWKRKRPLRRFRKNRKWSDLYVQRMPEIEEEDEYEV